MDWSLVNLGVWICMGVRIVPEAQPIVSIKAITIPIRPVRTADVILVVNFCHACATVA